MNKKYNLPDDFNSKLLSKSITLDRIGLNELGWKYEDIYKVIDILIDNHYAILGGDVYLITENTIESTFDNWYINKKNMDWTTFIVESKKKAIEYITSYNNKNAEKQKQLLYVLVYQPAANPKR